MGAIAFQTIIAALEAASVRYVVAGGFAVNLHGFLRATQDLDILIDLAPANAALAMATLTSCGMQPRVPVPMSDFVDAEKRREWYENRHMLVFQLIHPQQPFLSVDIFIRNPIDFDALWRRATMVDLGTSPCRVIGLDDLIAMKSAAGRPVDLRDVEELRRLARWQQGGGQ
jgi:hypothetical protein